jgi:hypothetical protein
MILLTFIYLDFRQNIGALCQGEKQIGDAGVGLPDEETRHDCPGSYHHG